MRILRSEEWFPASLEDAATGDWLATVAYEGSATAFVDGPLDPLRDYYYSFFALDGELAEPVRVQLHAADVAAARRQATIIGGAPQTPLLTRADWAQIAVPAAAIVPTMVATTAWLGPLVSLSTAAAFALVALWRIVDPRLKTYRMLEWCVIPGTAVIVLWLARLTAFVSASISGIEIDPRPLTLLRLALVLVALVGVSHMAELAQQESDPSRRRLLRIGLVALPLVALAAPPAALGLAAPLGAITLSRYVSVQRDRPNLSSTEPLTTHGASTAKDAPQ